MPVYESNEREILQEESTLIRGDQEITDGTAFLTSRRLIYEKKGKRSFLRASAPQTVINLPLFKVENVSTAVPKFKLMTRKTLTIEYTSEEGSERIHFVLKSPKTWEREIRAWIPEAQRDWQEKVAKEKEDIHKKQVDLESAKAPKASINMGYFIPGGSKEKEESTDLEKSYVDAEYSEKKKGELVPAAEKTCGKCGKAVTSAMKFCPNCGNQLS